MIEIFICKICRSTFRIRLGYKSDGLCDACAHTVAARLQYENEALRDTISSLKDFVDGNRNDNENIAQLINAVMEKKE